VGNEKIYTEMKELIDLLEQYVKENAVIIQSVSIEGRVASFCIDLPLQGNQISRIIDVLKMQTKQNNHDASFSIKTI
jgi:hypothetical protein